MHAGLRAQIMKTRILIVSRPYFWLLFLIVLFLTQLFQHWTPLRCEYSAPSVQSVYFDSLMGQLISLWLSLAVEHEMLDDDLNRQASYPLELYRLVTPSSTAQL